MPGTGVVPVIRKSGVPCADIASAENCHEFIKTYFPYAFQGSTMDSEIIDETSSGRGIPSLVPFDTASDTKLPKGCILVRPGPYKGLKAYWNDPSHDDGSASVNCSNSMKCICKSSACEACRRNTFSKGAAFFGGEHAAEGQCISCDGKLKCTTFGKVRQRKCREITECFGGSGVVGDSEYRRTSGYCEENVAIADEGRKALLYRVRNGLEPRNAIWDGGAPVFELYFCEESPSAPREECRHLTKTAPWREIRLTVNSEYGKRYPSGAYELTSLRLPESASKLGQGTYYVQTPQISIATQTMNQNKLDEIIKPYVKGIQFFNPDGGKGVPCSTATPCICKMRECRSCPANYYATGGVDSTCKKCPPKTFTRNFYPANSNASCYPISSGGGSGGGSGSVSDDSKPRSSTNDNRFVVMVIAIIAMLVLICCCGLLSCGCDLMHGRIPGFMRPRRANDFVGYTQLL